MKAPIRPQPSSPRWRGVPVAILALVIAAAGVWTAFHPWARAMPVWAGLAAAMLALLAGDGSALVRAVAWLRRPSAKARWLIAGALFIVSFRYFQFSADAAGRSLIPKFHDEFMYLLQAQMLAHGRLWMPQHPLADFFNSFLIVVRPVYAGIYFPGTALAYAPGARLGLAPWLTSLCISAAGVALLYVLVTDLADGLAGVLAAVLAIASEQWRTLAVATMSHPLLVALALAAMICLLRWSRRGRIGWAAAAGALAGWAAITRPVDAIALLLPAVIAAVVEARRNGLVAPRRVGLSLGVAVAAAAPFIALQFILDKGVTGHWLQTPVAAYDRANFPGMELGTSHGALPADSPSPLPQVRDYYREFLRPAFEASAKRGFFATWIVDRVPAVVRDATPSLALLPLLILGLFALRSPWRVAVAAAFVTVPLAYALLPIYLTHYGIIAAPAGLLLIALGAEWLARRAAGAKPAAMAAALSVGLVAFAVAWLPEVRRTPDHFFHAFYLEDVAVKLQDLEHKPAVVLFRYTGHTDVHQEPVYNIDVAWPDDAPVIRAQDRGDDDQRIFAYYAARQPERFFYLYDRATTELKPLGWAKALASRGTGP